MDPVNTLAGALLAGLITSVHCVGMCGPIACGLASMPASEGARMASMTLYHATRLTSYTMIGALCGLLGQQPLRWFFDSPAVLLPWVLVGFFLIFGLGLDKRLPRPPSLMKWSTRMRFQFGRLTPVRASIAMGGLTPLLPCGPLYLLFGAALLSGSPIRGAEFALGFGIGTVPLLWFVQSQIRHLRQRFSPAALVRIQRGLALITAVVLAFRLYGTLPGNAAPSDDPNELPACCH